MKKFLEEWEKQQNSLIERREERFSFMFEITRNLGFTVRNILDLGCGPGSLSIRASHEFPDANIFAVDFDPVLLKLARFGCQGKRIEVVEGNLAGDTWNSTLEGIKFDAVLSTTALHWISYPDLKRLYSKIFSMMSESSVFLDGDHFHSIHENESINKRYEEIRNKISIAELRKSSALDWDKWWDMIRESNEFSKEIQERGMRYGSGAHDQGLSLEDHITLLKNAGFEKIDLAWKYLDNCVLMAIK